MTIRWMKPLAVGALLSLPVGIGLQTVGCAQEAAPPANQTVGTLAPGVDAEGYKSLFNGKDTTGWAWKGNGPKIVDGALEIDKGSGDVWTTEQFENFVLDLEWKVTPGANSGIFIRNPKPGDWYAGMEIQIFDSFGKEKPGVHDAGANYDVLAPTKNAVKPAGEWNTMQITAAGPKLIVSINGEPVLDQDLDRWTEAGKNPDGSKNKFKTAYKDMPRLGHIELQDHGNKVWYRNIRIKELKLK